MLNLDTLRTMGMMIARQAREKAASDGVTANEVISMTALLKPWQEGVQTAGDVLVFNGYPYKVTQTHDSTGNPLWNPVDAPSLFAPYHATSMEHALPYATPTGAHDAYNTGECMIWTDGKCYKANRDSVVHTPDVLPEAWDVCTGE